MGLRAIQINVNHSGVPHNLALESTFEWRCDLVALSEPYCVNKDAVTHPGFLDPFSSINGLALIYVSKTATFNFTFHKATVDIVLT